MSRYKLRVVEYHDLEVLPEALITVTEAAKLLNISKPGVISAIERGVLSEVIDTEGGYHERRRLLRHEVEQLARERGKDVR